MPSGGIRGHPPSPLCHNGQGIFVEVLRRMIVTSLKSRADAEIIFHAEGTVACPNRAARRPGAFGGFPPRMREFRVFAHQTKRRAALRSGQLREKKTPVCRENSMMAFLFPASFFSSFLSQSLVQTLQMIVNPARRSIISSPQIPPRPSPARRVTKVYADPSKTK